MYRDCKKHQICHYLRDRPYCTDKVIEFNVPCPKEKCICDFKDQSGKLHQENIKKNEYCLLIQDRVKGIMSTIQPAETCANSPCACVDKDPKLGAVCYKDQVCTKSVENEEMLCVNFEIKPNEVCKNAKKERCLCRAAAGEVAQENKQWTWVKHGNTCVISNKEFFQMSETIEPNNVCESWQDTCMCKSVKNPGNQILCQSSEICVEFSTGLKCVPDITNLWTLAAEEMACRSNTNYNKKVTVCQKKEICTQRDELPFCVKTVIENGQKCPDPNKCLCKHKGQWSPDDGSEITEYSSSSNVCDKDDTCWTSESGHDVMCFPRVPLSSKPGSLSMRKTFTVATRALRMLNRKRSRAEKTNFV